MPDTTSLDNYRKLVSRVDELCDTIGRRLAGQITCRKGCDVCCRHLSLFPVEAAVLAEAVGSLSPSRRKALRDRAATVSPDGPCPLLDEHVCLVYEARPIICRTHGLPVLTRLDGEVRVDFCQENCRELASLNGDCVIDLDRLNAALTAINALFLQENRVVDPHHRPTMADIILSVPS